MNEDHPVTLKHPPGPPMTLGNMRELGVHHLIAFCSTTPAATKQTSTCRNIQQTPRSVVSIKGQMRQVRRSGPPDRRAAELERAARNAGQLGRTAGVMRGARGARYRPKKSPRLSATLASLAGAVTV
jgi:hypothetical protein